MQKIKVTLGGVEYSGLPLTLDDVEEVQRMTADKLFSTAIRLWLEDPETTPRAPTPLRLFPTEATQAAQVILGLSGFVPGENRPGAGLAN